MESYCKLLGAEDSLSSCTTCLATMILLIVHYNIGHSLSASLCLGCTCKQITILKNYDTLKGAAL